MKAADTIRSNKKDLQHHSLLKDFIKLVNVKLLKLHTVKRNAALEVP